MIEINVKTKITLENLLQNEGFNYNKIKALFRKKDIKVNGEKVNTNVNLKEGDNVKIYAKSLYNIPVVYEDEKIIIVDKPKKLEVISETKSLSLLNLISHNYFAVHRLDYNTEGLVVFAKNLETKNELDFAFKNQLVDKTYVTICLNKPQKSEMLIEDYLLKENNKVKIFKSQVKGSKVCKTKISLLEFKNGYSLLKVNLLTGRTHQIRAHLAFYNLFVLGDEKYGDFKTNKLLNLKSQILKCTNLKFHLNKGSDLYYLNNLNFSLNIESIENLFKDITKS